MLNLYKIRFYLFIFGCIGTRLLVTLASAMSPKWLLRIFGVIALFPVIGWFYLIFIGVRDTGLEVFGDIIWWKKLRPVHMLLWALFAYLAIIGNPYAWVVLLVDTLFGASAFFINHWCNGNLEKMLK